MSNALNLLVEGLKLLPGVGQKSATRMAFHLLQHDRAGAQQLAQALEEACSSVQHCQRCYTFTEDAVCNTCLDSERDARLLCVVETPSDQAALERTRAFRGFYFVLMGKISPLDGVSPQDIGTQALLQRACDGQVQEVIIATNFTAEGQLSAHVLTAALQARGLRVTRLARGVPMGSELEYVDLGTIAHALEGRS